MNDKIWLVSFVRFGQTIPFTSSFELEKAKKLAQKSLDYEIKNGLKVLNDNFWYETDVYCSWDMIVEKNNDKYRLKYDLYLIRFES